MFYKLKYNPEFEAHQNEKEEGAYQGHPTAISGKYLFGRRFETEFSEHLL